MKTPHVSCPLRQVLLIALISQGLAQTQNDLADIRRKTTFPPIDTSFLPVAISYQIPGTTEKKFYCVGSLYDHKVYGMVILTSEYVAKRDLVNEQILYADHLSERLSNYPTLNIGRIAKFSSDFKKHDALLYRVNSDPVVLKTSDQVQFAIQVPADKRVYGKYSVGNETFLRLKSLVTGIRYDIIGVCKLVISYTDFVMISTKMQPHEIGMALEDDLHGIYIVHGSPNEELRKTIIAEYKAHSGISIENVTFVSGPIPYIFRAN